MPGYERLWNTEIDCWNMIRPGIVVYNDSYSDDVDADNDDDDSDTSTYIRAVIL